MACGVVAQHGRRWERVCVLPLSRFAKVFRTIMPLTHLLSGRRTHRWSKRGYNDQYVGIKLSLSCSFSVGLIQVCVNRLYIQPILSLGIAFYHIGSRRLRP
ncbi:ABC transporter [Striga asiatica]|uniref:ABC transporter n=1 Tax=Striga asiatica TaxID=4170 RepID=A0A5A7QLV5_STRAF|nr:ABC transporter [Striga asiatica]